MDPLSVAANIIAVTQAVTASGMLLSKVLQLRHASGDYQALFNEVEALRGLLLIIKTALVRITGSKLYEEIREPVQVLLFSVQSAVQDLHSMIEYELKASEEPNKHGLPRLSKTAWLKSAGKLQSLRERIRDSRGNLVAGISALNLSTVVEVERHAAMQVQSICMLADRQSTIPLCTLTHSEPGSPQRTLTVQAEEVGLREGRRVDVSDKAKGTICVTTTMAAQQCSAFCICSCHKCTQGQTPVWLRSVVGQLMFNYTALLQVKACDYPPCRNDAQKSRFTYYFPQWMASRALMVSGNVNDLSGVGASWSIRVPTVIPANAGGQQRAVNSGRPEAYNFLIGFGAQQAVEEGSRGNRTAQAMALSTTDYRDYVLDDDAVAEELGFTVLHLSVALPSSERPLTEQSLKRQHENINARDRNGMTPLSWACRRGDLAATELLIDWNADVNSQDKLGRCALHHATYASDYACVAALLAAGAEVDLADVDGHTALFYLSHRGLALIDLLVQRDANVNHRDHFGWTPAHQAAQGDDNDELVAQLLRCGADVTIQNHNGWTAIDHAVAFDCPDVLSLLVGTQTTPRKKTRRTSTTNLPRSLSVRSDSGNTISSMLSFASRSTGSRRSRQLLLAPAVATKSSAWTFTKDGDTVLHLAARHAGTAVMKVLAAADLRGIDPDQRSRRGSTPDDCFYQHRDEDLLVDRSPSEQAEQAWEGLMSAVMLQNGLIGRVEDAEESCTAINDHDDKRQDKNEAFSKFQSSFSGIQLDESAVMGEDAIFVDAVRDLSHPQFKVKGHPRSSALVCPLRKCAVWSSPTATPSFVTV